MLKLTKPPSVIWIYSPYTRSVTQNKMLQKRRKWIWQVVHQTEQPCQKQKVHWTNFKTERICRRLYGQENDRRTGKTDVRSIGTVSEGITGISAGYKKGMSDKQALPFSLITKLEIGLEPTTPSLRVKCSTNWAISAYGRQFWRPLLLYRVWI